MNIVKISDTSITQLRKAGEKLSFKNKLELAKQLDKLGVPVIELEGIEHVKADSLLIKSIAATIKDSIIAVPVELDKRSIEPVWNALKEARKPRLQIVAPTSAVQMEYLYHKKPEAMQSVICNIISACREYTNDVEFIADDATRSDEAFLYDTLAMAIEAGATTVTVCDTAGAMLPLEFASFIRALYENVPSLKDVTLGASCSDALAMANACAIQAVREGAREIKTAAASSDCVSLADISRILAAKGSNLGVDCQVRITEMNRVMKQINWLCANEQSKTSAFESGVRDNVEELTLTENDDLSTVLQAVTKLGYDLSEEDGKAVYESFQQIIARKKEITSKELDAIVAAAALQVPDTYKLKSYVINAGDIITATAHITVTKGDEVLDGISLGDGPIDASFLAIEQIAGQHYELDDFQIRSVTEGHAAMGETVVRLRYDGKLYAGRGISTDIIGASIKAYVNAMNKIVYEEVE